MSLLLHSLLASKQTEPCMSIRDLDGEVGNEIRESQAKGFVLRCRHDRGYGRRARGKNKLPAKSSAAHRKTIWQRASRRLTAPTTSLSRLGVGVHQQMSTVQHVVFTMVRCNGRQEYCFKVLRAPRRSSSKTGQTLSSLDRHWLPIAIVHFTII
jgi:hypothetical protein